MSNSITIKDLARTLGISVSTVSRALKNHPDISSETCRAVQDLAKQLNYTPNAVALSLRQRKSNLIGIIIPQIIHHFFSCVISGIETIANQHGYNVIIFQSNEDFEREKSICKSVMNSQVDGLLVSISKETKSSDHFKEIQKANIPIVFFDRILGDINSDKVIVDDFNGAISAVEHLISIGCKRIAHLSAPQNLQIAQKRQLGYLEALRSAGMIPNKDLILPCDNQHDALEVTRKLMSLPNPPDGIFAVNDLTAAGAMYALRKMGYRIPEDVAVCGFTDGLVSTLTNPTLTTVEQHGDIIGKLATEMLLKRINNKNITFDSETKIVKTNLVVRESTLGFIAR